MRARPREHAFSNNGERSIFDPDVFGVLVADTRMRVSIARRKEPR